MRWDLRTPCKNCPFRTDETAIRFATRERAAEIEESAYRHGFPCHLSADFTGDDDEDGGYVFGDNTQHCAGAAIMYGRNSGGNVPFEHLPEEKQDCISNRLDWSAPVFESEDAFLESYGPEEQEEAA